MKRETQKQFHMGAGLLTAFLAWTIAVTMIDVQAIGPEGSTVGFATLNQFVHQLTGANLVLYHITDWLSLIPLGFVVSFALLGLVQWIRRNHILKVDYSILVLGGFYMTVMAVFIFFEKFVINYRPILIDGILEASYPSSTTMLVLCVMSTAIMQFQYRIKNILLRRIVFFICSAFTAFMVIGRLLSGVHWFSDIIGGVLLSAGLVMLYGAACQQRLPEC